MPYPAIKRVFPKDHDVHALEQNVVDALQLILKQEDGPKRLIPRVMLIANTPVNIDHGLGKDLRGYIVVLKDAPAQVWDEQATNPYPARTLRLVCDTDCMVSLLVF